MKLENYIYNFKLKIENFKIVSCRSLITKRSIIVSLIELKKCQKENPLTFSEL